MRLLVKLMHIYEFFSELYAYLFKSDVRQTEETHFFKK